MSQIALAFDRVRPPAHHLALEKNLALMAGAGAGKTYSLVTLCLHLLGGAREGRSPLRPSALFMLTFTDKAAAEMRSRLRQRLDVLAAGTSETEEPELRASFARLDKPFPRPDWWRSVRDELGAATIGTFHSLCVQLLRRAPPGFGVDPAFTLLDERDASHLVRDTAERVVLDGLEAEEPLVVELCRELGFVGRGRGQGLVDLLCGVFTKLREEGLAAARMELGTESAARHAFGEAVARARGLAAETSGLDLQHGGALADCLSAVLRALDGLTAENFLEPGRFPALLAVLGEERRQGKNGLRQSFSELKEAILGKKGCGLLDYYGGIRVAPYEVQFRALVDQLERRHREELAKRSVLDFSELLIRTRDLLRDHPMVRREVQERVGALLVDEFQDTNRLQLEIVTLLAEKRDEAPRSLRSSAEAVLRLPLESAFLCAVGDRKQSIYEFRGADVSVFEELARRIETTGGVRHFLQDNWRSSPSLLQFFNRLFVRVLQSRGDGTRKYEVVYRPEGDDLRPRRDVQVPGPCVDRIIGATGENAEEARRLDAEGVARLLHQLLRGDAPAQVVAQGALRPARGGEVAILLRRFTHLETYRQALTRCGIPHRVVRGRGFYGAQEVMDLASLLALIADPEDALAFAAVLRSPLVAVSDSSLFRLAIASQGRLTLPQVRGKGAGSFGLSEAEAARLERLLSLHQRLRREKDRLGIRVLLKVALEETGYRVAMAGTAYGEQVLANLEKLLELAGHWDSTGRGDCTRFSRELLALADLDPTEAQADVLDAADPRAVQIMTIHQAKGLEWPIVVVPDLAAPRTTHRERAAFDRELGLGLKPLPIDESWTPSSPRFEAVKAELARREEAELQRLLYVALTRARDRIILSGQSANSRKDHWRALIERALEEDSALAGLVRDVRVEELPEVRPVAAPEVAPTPAELERLTRAVTRVRAPRPLQPAQVVLPVTHLQNYFLCPRRYLYLHQVGLAEFPLVIELERDDHGGDGSGTSAQDRRVRGTIAHRVLERLELAKVTEGGTALAAHVDELLWAEGLEPKGEGARDIAEWVLGFWRTDFGKRLAQAGARRIHRELPFLLSVPSPDREFTLHLKGQIDLLFEDEDGGATVIDYKASQRHPAGLSPYEFQLDCYALAARHFVQEGVAIRTGIAFLREERPGPDLRAPSAPSALGAFEGRLVESARALIRSSHGSEWTGREEEYCASIKCGYRYRCHSSRGA